MFPDSARNQAMPRTRCTNRSGRPGSQTNDLVFSTGPRGEHTMAVAGEARRPATGDMLRVADTCGIDAGRARQTIAEVGAAVDRWPEFARETGISEARIREIGAVFASIRAG